VAWPRHCLEISTSSLASCFFSWMISMPNVHPVILLIFGHWLPLSDHLREQALVLSRVVRSGTSQASLTLRTLWQCGDCFVPTILICKTLVATSLYKMDQCCLPASIAPSPINFYVLFTKYLPINGCQRPW